MVLKDHLEKLYYFYEVAKAGTFKEAANKIAITQPSLTKSIQVLEGAVDKKLFVRQPRGVQLTLEGELLMNYCHQLFAQLSDLEIKLASPEDPMAGSLRVGTYDSIAIYFWPQFLKSFLPKYPHLSLKLTTGRSQQIQEQVEKGELDFGLIIEPRTSLNIQVVDLATDHFALYATCDAHPSYPNQQTAPLIYMPEAVAGGQHRLLKKYLKPLKEESQRIEYHTSSLESAKELVINGIGLGLLPTRVAKADVKSQRIQRVEDDNFPKEGIGEHRIGLIYSKHREKSATLQKLIQELSAEEY